MSTKEKKTNVLITFPLGEDLIEELQNISPKLKIISMPSRIATDIPSETWKAAEILITDQVLPMPKWVPNLRWIQFNYAGIDFLLDQPIMGNTEVTKTTLSGAAAPQVAEYALMMMLALGHKLPAMLRYQRSHEWLPDRYSRLMPTELRGKTVGLIGYGSIGREIARLLKPFGVKILATKRNVMNPADTGYTPEGLGDPKGDLFTRLYPIQAVKSVLKECDFVVVSLPKTETPIDLIGEEEISVMKPEAFLVDVGRGGIINMKALRHALIEKHIAGAALDVFAEEPIQKDSKN